MNMNDMADLLRVAWVVVLLIFGLAAFLYLWARPLQINSSATQTKECPKTRSEALMDFIAIHEQPLARKRRQLVQKDAYGNENI
jgi:hypothetical protein